MGKSGIPIEVITDLILVSCGDNIGVTPAALVTHTTARQAVADTMSEGLSIEIELLTLSLLAGAKC